MSGQTFSKGQWVWVTDSSEAVTVGVIDPDSGEQVFSEPGLYRALQDVAPVSDGGDPPNFGYHIPLPQLPDPDDVTDPTNYWMLMSAEGVCL